MRSFVNYFFNSSSSDESINENELIKDIRENNVESIKRWVKEGHNVPVAALYESRNNEAILKIFKKHAVNKKYLDFVCLPNNSVELPLHQAILQDNMSLVSILLNAGANPNALDGNGKSPMDIALQYNREKAITLLRIYNDDVVNYNSQVFSGANVNNSSTNTSNTTEIYNAFDDTFNDNSVIASDANINNNSTNTSNTAGIYKAFGDIFNDNSVIASDANINNSSTNTSNATEPYDAFNDNGITVSAAVNKKSKNHTKKNHTKNLSNHKNKNEKRWDEYEVYQLIESLVPQYSYSRDAEDPYTYAKMIIEHAASLDPTLEDRFPINMKYRVDARSTRIDEKNGRLEVWLDGVSQTKLNDVVSVLKAYYPDGDITGEKIYRFSDQGGVLRISLNTLCEQMLPVIARTASASSQPQRKAEMF